MAMIQVNLLPKEMRRGAGGFHLPKTALAGVAGSIVLAGLLVGVTYYQKMRLSHVTSEVARVEEKTSSMRKDIEMVDRLVDVKTRILKRMNAIDLLDRGRGAWVQNIEDLSVVVPDFLWISEFRQGANNDGRNRKNTPAQPATPTSADSVKLASNAVTLDGYCFTLNSLSNLIVNLQDSPRFSNVQLRYAKLTDVRDRRVYTFQVGCQLEPLDAKVKNIENGASGPSQLGDTTAAPGRELSSNDNTQPESGD